MLLSDFFEGLSLAWPLISIEFAPFFKDYGLPSFSSWVWTISSNS